VRFFLDHNINALVRKMLDGQGHECWTATQAGRRLAKDEDLAVYADDKGAVVVSHDIEFASWRRRRTWGQHVWLHCVPPDAPDVLARHLTEVIGYLTNMPAVVIEVRPDRVIAHPPRWE
jgi:predicted nuclease of predicted toxin-antitoxin system